MAVLTTLKGVTAQIIVSGLPAAEIVDRDEIEVNHEDPTIQALQAARTVSKYIESRDDEPFSIKVGVAPPYKIDCSKLEFQIFVDGELAWKPVCERPRLAENDGLWEDIVEGPKTGKGSGCRVFGFKFAKIETSNRSRLELLGIGRQC
jgi:hypothetical protein